MQRGPSNGRVVKVLKIFSRCLFLFIFLCEISYCYVRGTRAYIKSMLPMNSYNIYLNFRIPRTKKSHFSTATKNLIGTNHIPLGNHLKAPKIWKSEGGKSGKRRKFW